MVSIEEAIGLIESHVTPTERVKEIEISDSLGCVLAMDVYSQINMPPFRQSAMDGYAVRAHSSLSYTVIGEVKAGDGHEFTLNEGEAVRIFTGAPVPDDANAIVIQEHVNREQDRIHLEKEVTPNANIRAMGEQITEGELAVAKGTLIRPATVGFFASLGVTTVSVFEKPSIGIVVTGSELRPPGTKLEFGEIYESNATMLSSALRHSGYPEIATYQVSDSYEATVALLEKVISEHDVVLVSGGISVGDYDFVGSALNEIGVQEVFYKVKQKPGKPLFMGTLEDKLVFALPGNPASALSCFYVYALPALNILAGREEVHLERRTLRAMNTFSKRGDRPQFLKVSVSGGEVTVLDGQASSMIHTFSMANALGYLPAEVSEIKKGDNLEVLLLPSI